MAKKSHWWMSLRGKTVVIVLAALVCLVAGLFSVTRLMILRGFSMVEEDFARQNLDRASSAITNERETIEHATNQYADRDFTYNMLRSGHPEKVAAEFTGPAFEQLRVNFVVVLDPSGRKVFASGFNLAGMEAVPPPADLDRHLRFGSPFLIRNGEVKDVEGLLMLASGPVLVASSPILTSSAAGPAAGVLIMGRSLDSDEIARLDAMTHVSLEIDSADSPSARADLAAASSAKASEDTVFVRPYPGDSLAAYESLSDIYGKPVAVLRVLLPRTIYQQGQTSSIQFLLLLMAAGFAFGAIVLYLIERVVLSRMADLSDHITRVGTGGNLAARVPLSGHDEVARLGATVNGMLDDLERVQKARHEERTRLAVMIENMPAIIWTTDADLRFTYHTGAALETLGFHADEALGKTVFEYFGTEDPNFPAIAAHRKALAGATLSFELDWQKRSFDCYVQPLRGADGNLIGVIGVALDVTDRKHLTDQLRQSQKMQAIGELAGGVAHDFNNLLMVVKGHAQLLLQRMPKDASLHHSVEQMEKAADRAASLTRQLLAFSRKQVLQPRVLDMNDVVGGMIKMFSRVIGENIEMAFVPGANLGRTKADPGQIEQVLLNLVVNARDAMPDGGRLTIETANVQLDHTYAAGHVAVEPGPYIMLTVTDTGCGMDAETQSRIFEPFFTTKEAGKGTGLGLATVYGVVKQSGGYIWVYSEVGCGSTFKIYLPQVAEEVEAPVVTSETGGSLAGTETILFVEDEQSVRELVRDYLRGEGYSVLDAGDGIEALQVAAAHNGPIHILVTDVVMPRLSGRDLAARLSAERRNLKILFISGYTDDTVVRHGVLDGGVAFLQKPFNLKALAEKIREVLKAEAHPAVPAGGARTM
ncbi:MAG: CHASE4 domain-containing protein [Candidatus Acidiferrales bacterium]